MKKTLALFMAVSFIATAIIAQDKKAATTTTSKKEVTKSADKAKPATTANRV